MVSLDRGLDVLKIIFRHSRSNPVTGEQIAVLTGWDPVGIKQGGVSPREIAEVVGAAAERGIRVASCSQGYYHPTAVELQEYLAREKHRLMSLGRKISRAKRNAADELTLFEQEAA